MHGSLALAHENAMLSVPNIDWLGLKVSDLATDCSEHTTHQVEGLLPLSTRDREKAQQLLAHTADCPLEIVTELQRMLHLNHKAEIQLLEARPGGVGKWLEHKLLCRTPMMV
jgi:meiotic recombination protein SPO11